MIRGYGIDLDAEPLKIRLAAVRYTVGIGKVDDSTLYTR